MDKTTLKTVVPNLFGTTDWFHEGGVGMGQEVELRL